LHPPGGVVGGDELKINIELEKQAAALITTPGATKFYRNAITNNTKDTRLKSCIKLARQIQTLKIADGCALEWFPQENIFFNQTHSHLSTRIELAKNARFMGWEINCYGTPASKQLFENGSVLTQMEIFRDGIPLMLDGLLLEDRLALQSPVSLNTYPCFATFVSTQATTELLDKARASIAPFLEQKQHQQQQIGITLLDDLLVVRCLGQHAEQVSTTLKAVWSALRPDIMQRPVCLPRIWAT